MQHTFVRKIMKKIEEQHGKTLIKYDKLPHFINEIICYFYYEAYIVDYFNHPSNSNNEKQAFYWINSMKNEEMYRFENNALQLKIIKQTIEYNCESNIILRQAELYDFK